MARYLVTEGSNFTPLTYGEMVAPIQAADTAHAAVQDVYDKMSMDTRALERYISETNDPRAHELYSNYINKLDALQNNLWNNGITSQTRKDLSSARNSYASDIARVQKAIETRQEQSKEYWDTKHNHPDMIMGDDPGISSLDNFLADVNYGNNYFTYSGTDFMNEVGKDAKARASEMLRNPEYRKNPELIGYIEQIKRNGYTGAQVNRASNAVLESMNGTPNAYKGLSFAEKILADVLVSHLESTGAKDKVSRDEYLRLFKYGKAGLAQAIGDEDLNLISDKQWEYDRKAEIARLTNGANNPTNNGYTLNTQTTRLASDSAEKNNTFIFDKLIKPFTDGNGNHTSIPYVTSDGKMAEISSAFAADRIWREELRPDIITEKYGIPVPGQQPVDKEWEMPDGRKARLHREPAYGGAWRISFQVSDYNGTGFHNDEELLAEYQKDMADYYARKDAWSKRNPNIDLDELRIKEKDWQKIYRKNNIPDDIPREYAPYILNVLSRQHDAPWVTIGSPTQDMDDVRENFGDLFVSGFINAAGSKGSVAKTDPNAIYPVDGYNIGKEGKQKLEDVIPYDPKTGKYKTDAILGWTALPEDIIAHKIRMNVGGKQWAVNPALINSDMKKKTDALNADIPEEYTGGKKMGLTEYLMLPILDPVRAFKLSDEQMAAWSQIAENFLGNNMTFIYDNNGQIINVSPKDIILDPDKIGQLRASVTSFIDDVYANVRDYMMLQNMQTRSNTSDKASSFTGRIQ